MKELTIPYEIADGIALASMQDQLAYLEKELEDHEIIDPLLEGIYAALYYNINKNYTISIEQGFYNPTQMYNELTNKFNEVVTNTIITFFNDNPIEYAEAKSLFTQYDRFNIVYNNVYCIQYIIYIIYYSHTIYE